jgi:hypothetical protein
MDKEEIHKNMNVFFGISDVPIFSFTDLFCIYHSAALHLPQVFCPCREHSLLLGTSVPPTQACSSRSIRKCPIDFK